MAVTFFFTNLRIQERDEIWLSWFILIIHLVFRVNSHNNLLIVTILTTKQNFCWEILNWNIFCEIIIGKSQKWTHKDERLFVIQLNCQGKFNIDYLHLCSTLLFCSLHNPYHHYMPLRTKQIIIWVVFLITLEKKHREIFTDDSKNIIEK